MTVALVGSVAFVVIVVILVIGLVCIRRSVPLPLSENASRRVPPFRASYVGCHVVFVCLRINTLRLTHTYTYELKRARTHTHTHTHSAA